MRKNLRVISFAGLSLFALVGLSVSCIVIPPDPPKTKGIVAIVYSDLTKSINEETAVRQKQNIEQLFQNLPVNTKFFLSGIDRGTSSPTIYEFTPKFVKVTVAQHEKELKKQIADVDAKKKSAELKKLSSSLNSYHTSITKEEGRVSCISNKLNSLLDTISNKKRSFPEYEIRVFFYSDMIEECDNSFDGKPLTFKRSATEKEEAAHLLDIQKRIEQNFQQASPEKSLQSLGTKIYIVLTSQDDKQNLPTLKTIWRPFFVKLGYDPNALVWANTNDDLLWQFDQNDTKPATP